MELIDWSLCHAVTFLFVGWLFNIHNHQLTSLLVGLSISQSNKTVCRSVHSSIYHFFVGWSPSRSLTHSTGPWAVRLSITPLVCWSCGQSVTYSRTSLWVEGFKHKMTSFPRLPTPVHLRRLSVNCVRTAFLRRSRDVRATPARRSRDVRVCLWAGGMRLRSLCA